MRYGECTFPLGEWGKKRPVFGAAVPCCRAPELRAYPDKPVKAFRAPVMVGLSKDMHPFTAQRDEFPQATWAIAANGGQ